MTDDVLGWQWLLLRSRLLKKISDGSVGGSIVVVHNASGVGVFFFDRA
jgi:hypothetical protein